jgi:hypothetical protein
LATSDVAGKRNALSMLASLKNEIPQPEQPAKWLLGLGTDS